MESVAAFVWNGWQLCRGISGRIHLELVAALPWNTHKSTLSFRETLLLDSRVVDVPRAYNRTFVMLSSLKPFFFNSLQKELRFSDNAGA